jgi:DNA-binding SARP family transcriptional activator
MEFRILGPLEVLDDGRAITVAGRKQRTLLAVLLLNANRVVSIDSLIDALWGESPPGTAGKAIQVYVSQLRRLLGKGHLQTKTPGYVFKVESNELDLHRFEELLHQAKDPSCEAPAERLQSALALWRGPALEEFAYESFARLELARIDELRLTCLEERIESDLTGGRHAEIIGELEALVAEHPLRERLRGQLMLALYRSGRQAEALDVYQETRRVLVDELGIEPGKSLRERERAILQQDPSLDLVSVPAEIPEGTDSSRSVFVGRDTELAELIAGLDASVGGRGGLFLLAGEPGIGKSRLAEELLREARLRGASVLAGRCWEAGGAPAYWPWVQSLRSYVEQCEREKLRAQLGSGAAEVAQIVPELRELFPALEEPGLESEGARFRLFDSTARFLQSAAADQPILLVLDDLHAADEPSLLLLRFVAGELGGSRILLVGTYRDVDPTVRDPLASTLAELARESVTRRIELRGLTEQDVGRYIELSAGTKAPAQLVTTIHEETEGNPLFVGEVVRLLATEGRLPKVDVPSLWTLGIPQGVREVIGRRVRRLSPDCTRVLTLASVVGREFGLDVVQQLSEVSGEQLLEVLDEALAARVLAPVPGARGRLRFAHALIRETLYDQLSTPRRLLLHHRVGEALEEFYAQDPEPHLAELAYHFSEASGADVDKALMYAERAGDRAVALLAFEEAARLYDLALETLELRQRATPLTRCELLLKLGEVQARAGAPAVESTFLEAAEIARAAGAPELLARAALGSGGRFVWVVSGFMPDHVVALLEDAVQALGPEESAVRARLLARLACALRDQPDSGRCAELSAQAVQLARKLEDRSALAYALDGRYAAIWRHDNPEERLRTVDEILRLAEDVGDRERAIQGHFYRAFALLELGELDDVHGEVEAMEVLAVELRQPAQRWFVTVFRSILALFEGDFERAEELIPKSLELAETLRNFLPRGSFAMQMFMLRREWGDLDLEVALAKQNSAEAPTVTVFSCVLADLCARLGREADARSILESLAEIDFEVLPDNDKLFSWSLLAGVCAKLGIVDHARRLYELMLPGAHRNAVCHPGGALGSVSHYLGQLAMMGERWEEAEQHFSDALAMNAKMGAHPWVAHTQLDLARMLLARSETGDQEKAERLVSEALTTCEQLGMPVADLARN